MIFGNELELLESINTQTAVFVYGVIENVQNKLNNDILQSINS